MNEKTNTKVMFLKRKGRFRSWRVASAAAALLFSTVCAGFAQTAASVKKISLSAARRASPVCFISAG